MVDHGQNEDEYIYAELQHGWGDDSPLPPILDLNLDALKKVPQYEPSSWRPYAAEEYYNSEPQLPTILARDDGEHLLYEGKAHSFVGPFESLKSWAAMLACKELMQRGQNVIYLDFENGPGPTFRRFKFLGVPLQQLKRHFAYIAPRDPLMIRDKFTSGALELGTVGMTFKPQLIVTDGVTECFSLHGLDVNNATDVAKYHKMLHRRFSGQVTTLEIDHIAKTLPESGRTTALGSQHKEAGIDGAVYEFRPLQLGGVGGISTAAIYLVKDRDGYVNSLANNDRFIGTFTMDPNEGVYIKANTGEEMHDTFDLIFKAIAEQPSGNKSLAEQLNVSLNKVRISTSKLHSDGLIDRDDKQRWFAVGPHI